MEEKIKKSAIIIMSKSIVKDLNKILDEAIDLNEKVQDEIARLIKELNKRMEVQPKFDLNESFSSISTYA